ncbi:methyltransferase domain-containing protein [Sphingomonas sp. CGMCC 1.13654]|uniref:Methyltransferase domain-containing protein n=1 Tax=Sphingomonas chungangi TaxID=2683589 RepID=A0A838L5X4_9SPHN|nr:methyltransferase domain-containing protein [Sphingomonas chungangi]MBA2934330.1 methyltransferase domain-containing protein [Sphingomonas chungangi]MVW57370.1 methyltransferase domain-containing protein [Sphingomonas chungangi]
MSSLASRSTEAEWMDGEDVSPEVFAAVVADLATVNTVTLARPPTLEFVALALRTVPPAAPVTILDVGFGDGDMLRAIARRFRGRSGLRLIGYDINPRSQPAASARTPEDMPIEYRTGDAFAIDPGEPVDLIISSLVTHHMRDPEIVRFLGWMEMRAARGWFVNDLHRHWIAYHGFRLLGAVARWHPFVRHDGAVSVARSFRRDDWEAIIVRAGLDRATIALRWHMPFRWCLGRLR